jgi:hypothetical protein
MMQQAPLTAPVAPSPSPSSRSPSPATQSSARPDGQQPSGDDVARFRNALGDDRRRPRENRERDRDADDERGEHASAEEDGLAASDGGAPAFAGIFGLFQAPQQDTPPAPAEAATTTDRANEVIAAVAAAIQASTDGAQAVRVQVRPEVLPGVAFTVTQDSGRWVVDFDVSDPASAGLLQAAGDRMSAELARRTGRGVDLRVNPTARADGNLDMPRRFIHQPVHQPDPTQENADERADP